MKKIIVLALSLFANLSIFAQNETDTLYYDKEWKGIDKAFATYFRIIPILDNDDSKPFRDFYITGELQSEGKFILIDRNDDAKSIFDGELINYYKSGKIAEKTTFLKGIQEGEYTKYSEDGLVLIHANFKNNKLHGIYTEFGEDGKSCIQIEYNNGNYQNDYYTISNSNGCCSKIRFSNNEPIYESPLLEEQKTEYKNGEEWPYYNKNGIIVSMTNNEVRDYGRYYQISMIIVNNSLFPIEFDPNNITASMIDVKNMVSIIKVLSAEEYMKKVKRSQNWAMALNGLAEGIAASGAGYSTSTTNSSYSGYSSGYGSVSAYGNGGSAYGNLYSNTSYYGSSTSTTTTYNAAAAYQAQIIANERIAAYDNALLTERVEKNEGYLKKNFY